MASCRTPLYCQRNPPLLPGQSNTVRQAILKSSQRELVIGTRPSRGVGQGFLHPKMIITLAVLTQTALSTGNSDVSRTAQSRQKGWAPRLVWVGR